MSTKYEMLLKESAKKLAVEWWQEMESKLGKEFATEIANYYANEILRISQNGNN